jgi:cytochrome c oxidase subunit 2
MAARSEDDILRLELRWGLAMLGVTAVIFIAIVFAAVKMRMNPPSNAEVVDSKTLQLSGEFAEDNLGTRVGGDGQVTVRIVATQFTFAPQCVVVPANRPVTLRFASADVIHGILVTGTNVNTMIVPGYVSQVHTVFTHTGDLLMPCHEYCGLGHSEMLGTVRVVSPDDFKPDSQGRASCAQK